MRLRNVLTILVCIFLCGCTMNINVQKFDNIAEQYAQYEFGALIPRICYADADRIIIYEDHGVLAYSVKDERICGYAPLPDHGILQGDNAIAIYASGNGKSVYAVAAGADYSLAAKDEKMYVWNISEESFKQTDAVPYEDMIWKPIVFEGSVDETGSVYPIDSIYAYGEQGYCYLGLEPGENTENVRYSDIRLVVNENGMQKEYIIFKSE